MMSVFSTFVFLILFLFFMNWYLLVMGLCFLFFLCLITSSFGSYYLMIGCCLGADLLSFSLIFLSLWIIILMILASGIIFKKSLFEKEFLYVNMFLLFFLFLSFSSYNLFMYYLFFECSLIPTVFLIFGWGYQPERLISGYYLLFYTLFFSLPMLLGIFYIDMLSFTMFYFMISINCGFYLYICMVMAFLVKMPLVFVHFWLPKAHVEAPVSGSMILAGVLLKLGGYGLMRVFFFMNNCVYNYLFIIFSLFGLLMVGFLCLFQIDMKYLIAYSSVSHMGLVICGLMSLNYLGMVGSLLMMIAHGLCSSGMFCLANISYERSGSRSLLINKGLLVFMPSISMFWFLLMINNMASPPSINLLGEILLINSVFSWSNLSIYFLMFSSFISCLYSIFLYGSLNHGNLYSGLGSMSGGYICEYIVLLMHWIPLNLLFLKIDVFLMML